MTKIEWTEETWNPIVGCSLASPGCTNCYAMKMAGRIEATGHPSYQGLTAKAKTGFVWTGKLALNEKALLEPLRWKKPRTIFVNSMGDLFHDHIPDEWIDRVFAVMALCPQHTFQVLTKRSARMREYITKLEAEPQADTIRRMVAAWPPGAISQDMVVNGPNVWLGVSVEDQQRADERIPDLLATPAAVRWISAEPLLGLVDLRAVLKRDFLGKEIALDTLTGERLIGTPDLANGEHREEWSERLDWIVVGGESGPGARPMHPDWARALRDQCAAAGVPFFMKQMGGAVKSRMPEIPDDLMVREYPNAR